MTDLITGRGDFITKLLKFRALSLAPPNPPQMGRAMDYAEFKSPHLGGFRGA